MIRQGLNEFYVGPQHPTGPNGWTYVQTKEEEGSEFLFYDRIGPFKRIPMKDYLNAHGSSNLMVS